MYGNGAMTGAMTGMTITPMLTKPTRTVRRRGRTASNAAARGLAMRQSVPCLIGTAAARTTAATTAVFALCVPVPKNKKRMFLKAA